MSTLPSAEMPASQAAPLAAEGRTATGRVTPFAAVLLAAGLGILGLATISSSVLALWTLWTTNALKSIGMLVPVVSFLLILRVWRRLGWELEGSWWGFALLLLVTLTVRFRDQTILVLILSPQWSLFFPPHSVIMFLYGLGLVLLFGGARLVRESVFPLVLLLLCNPVPHVFNVWVDLPLQQASAHVARSFALALGQPLSPDKLRLMFTPSFGMFIAPGCNGIRGAVTMGFIALVAGYLYRFRWQAHAAAVVGAITLGYLFNFIRLCLLVLYYLVALHLPRLQDQAENADYLIGGALFFCGVSLLYTVIQRLGRSSRSVQAALPEAPVSRVLPFGFYAHAAAMALLIIVSSTLLVQKLRASATSPQLAADEKAMGQFPQAVGSYTLVRTWNETLTTGGLLFHWAEYAPALAPGTHIAIGISPLMGSHDTLICHSARGEDPLWHGQTTYNTRAGEPVNFSTAFYNDGAVQFLEATTLCNGSSCGEYSTPPATVGFVWSKPHPETLLSQDPERPIPILLKAETVDTTLPADLARRQLSGEVGAFLSGIDLAGLTYPYRRR